jgi:hypothetical protein
MTRIVQVRLALFGIGILVWGYGVAVGDRTIRWVGIGVLLVSLVLRFFQRGRRNGGPPSA